MIDINAYLGHFAFRQLRYNTAPGLLHLMDRAHIQQAAVSSASAITYRNSHSGNEEIAAQTKSHKDRLIPFAVLNPAYSDWQHDLRQCHEEFGMKGLRLYPHWHNYKLTDSACLELIQAATERQMVISIPFRVEDRRQGTWLVDIPDVTMQEAEALVKAAPKAQFIFGNGGGFTGSLLGKKNNGLPSNYSIEISLLTAVMANEIGALIDAIGDDRVLLGSGMPFHYPEASVLKVDVLDASAATKAKIREGNARRLLRL